MFRGRILAGALILSFATAGARAEVNLEWRPDTQTVLVGDLVEIGLYAVYDDDPNDPNNPDPNDPNAVASMAAMDVILSWDPARLQLLGVDNTGGPGWQTSTFLPDPYGLNETLPPQDGDGIYTAFAPFGSSVYATAGGTLVTTFQFDAVGSDPNTVVDILESAGLPQGHTAVYSGDIPNLNILGTRGQALVTIYCMSCPGDLNGDDFVDLADLAQLLAHYPTASGAMPEDGDLNCDGDVDLSDLAALLSVYYSTCP